MSGEYRLMEDGLRRFSGDRLAVCNELLMSIERSGADLILTYAARTMARWLDGSGEAGGPRARALGAANAVS